MLALRSFANSKLTVCMLTKNAGLLVSIVALSSDSLDINVPLRHFFLTLAYYIEVFSDCFRLL